MLADGPGRGLAARGAGNGGCDAVNLVARSLGAGWGKGPCSPGSKGPDMRLVRQLGREDWITAGVAALVARGAAGFRVEPVARDLGVSKGSFYWHFRDRNAWRDAVLGWWEHRIYAALVHRQRPGAAEGGAVPGGGLPPGRDRPPGADGPLRPGPGRSRRAASGRRQGRAAPDRHDIPPELEPALRLWAHEDIGVALCLQRVAAERRLSPEGPGPRAASASAPETSGGANAPCASSAAGAATGAGPGARPMGERSGLAA